MNSENADPPRPTYDFDYSALDPRGKEACGIIHAADAEEARGRLRDLGYTPISIEKAKPDQVEFGPDWPPPGSFSAIIFNIVGGIIFGPLIILSLAWEKFTRAVTERRSSKGK